MKTDLITERDAAPADPAGEGASMRVVITGHVDHGKSTGIVMCRVDDPARRGPLVAAPVHASLS
jgi:hypothetical protein